MIHFIFLPKTPKATLGFREKNVEIVVGIELIESTRPGAKPKKNKNADKNHRIYNYFIISYDILDILFLYNCSLQIFSFPLDFFFRNIIIF